jgi:hypothetical protein
MAFLRLVVLLFIAYMLVQISSCETVFYRMDRRRQERRENFQHWREHRRVLPRPNDTVIDDPSNDDERRRRRFRFRRD